MQTDSMNLERKEPFVDAEVFPERVKAEIWGLVDSVLWRRKAFVMELVMYITAHSGDNE